MGMRNFQWQVDIFQFDRPDRCLNICFRFLDSCLFIPVYLVFHTKKVFKKNYIKNMWRLHKNICIVKPVSGAIWIYAAEIELHRGNGSAYSAAFKRPIELRQIVLLCTF